MSNLEPVSKPQNEKEWRLIEKLVMSLQAEQKRDRRWRIFFRLLGFGYLLLMLVLFYPTRMGTTTDTGITTEHTALVDVKALSPMMQKPTLIASAQRYVKLLK